MSGTQRQAASPLTGGPGERIGLWGWLTLYITGAILFFLLLAHLFASHFVGEKPINAAVVRGDVESSFLSVVSIGLLLVGLLHGLLGLRRVLLDLELFGKKGDQWLKTILLVAGLGLAAAGWMIFRGMQSL